MDDWRGGYRHSDTMPMTVAYIAPHTQHKEAFSAVKLLASVIGGDDLRDSALITESAVKTFSLKPGEVFHL